MKRYRYILAMLLAMTTMLATIAGSTTTYKNVNGVYYSFSGSNATVTCKSHYTPVTLDLENTYDGWEQYLNDYSGSVAIPANVTYNGKTYTVKKIANYAFCNIKKVGEPDQSFSATVITGSNITSVSIPYTVTSIEKSAFRKCTKLTKIVCHVGTPISINANVFTGVTQSSVTLSVPTKSVSKYKNAAVWKNFKITSFVEKVAKLSLNKSSLTLEVGKTEKLTATVLPTHADNTNVTWKSSNSAVATVNNGTITAIAPGTTTIKATAADGSGKTASCTVTVKQIAASEVQLNTDMLLLEADATSKLTATVLPATASNKEVTWLTNNSAVATVDADGYVTGVSPGKARVRATVADGSGMSAVCIVAVTAKMDKKDVFVMSGNAGNIVPGLVNETISVPVSLFNTNKVKAISLTVSLPERIELVDDISSFLEKTARGDCFDFTAARNDDGTITIIGIANNEPIEAGNGAILNLKMKTQWQNTYTLSVTDMTVTTVAGEIKTLSDNATKLVIQGVRGDMNGDGRIDASDALYIYHMSMGLAE